MQKNKISLPIEYYHKQSYSIFYSIRSSHKFVPTFVYTFHVSIYKHTAIRDQCIWA